MDCLGFDANQMSVFGMVVLGALLISSIGWNLQQFFSSVKGKTLKWVKKATDGQPKPEKQGSRLPMLGLMAAVAALAGYIIFID